jgi:hypothetical protein
MAVEDEATCVIVPPGLQALLMYTGLVRHLASASSILLCTEVVHITTVRRLFGDVDVRFWFDKEEPHLCASTAGFRVLVIDNNPIRAYNQVGLLPGDMHRLFDAHRDLDREEAVLRAVVDSVGSTFVLTAWGGSWDCVDRMVLPDGIPAVDISEIRFDNPLDLRTLLAHAMQVHAVDSWLLTLADVVGGSCRLFCHTLDDSVSMCRKKFRKRVTMIVVPISQTSL